MKRTGILNSCRSEVMLSAVKVAKKARRKTESQLLEKATKNLVVALKKDMLAKERRVDHEKLRKDGYSERLLDRFDNA
jgi:hypothetical protein